MTVMSAAVRASERFVSPPTSGLDSDALLVSRPPQGDGWSQHIDELLDMLRMEDDWDGLGAPAPAPALVDSSLSLALLLREDKWTAPSRVVPGVTGTVLFEWQDADGGYYEIEVTRPGFAEWVRMLPGQQTTSGAFEW
jgi:hypothetical protein